MADPKKKKATPKQRSILQFFGSNPSTSAQNETFQEQELFCQYCGFKAIKECARKTHEMHCKSNPKRINKKSVEVTESVSISCPK